MLVAGPTGSGKTVLVQKLIQFREEIYDVPPKKIYWCHGQDQPEMHAEMRKAGIVVMKGMPEHLAEEIEENSMLVIDDLMGELKDSEHITDIFTRITHHRRVTCIFLSQNLFQQGAQTRTRSLNANYICLMKNPRDRSQIGHLARQIYPDNSKFLIKVYHDATEKPFSYLLLDFRQETSELLRLRTGILPTDERYIVYLKGDGDAASADNKRKRKRR
jgi:adenylate kinase family enzyme